MVCQESIQNFISTLDLYSKESIPTKFTDIEDFNKYMINEANHKVDVFNEDDIWETLLGNLFNCEKIRIINLKDFFYEPSFYKKKKCSTISFPFDKLKEIKYVTTKGYVGLDRQGMSGLLSSVLTFVYDNKCEINTIVKFKQSLEDVYLYNIGGAKHIVARGGRGNNRLLGCLLFHPFINNSSFLLNNFHYMSSNKNFSKNLKIIQKIYFILEMSDYYSKIHFIKKNAIWKIKLTIYNDQNINQNTMIFNTSEYQVDVLYQLLCSEYFIESLKSCDKYKQNVLQNTCITYASEESLRLTLGKKTYSYKNFKDVDNKLNNTFIKGRYLLQQLGLFKRKK